MGSSMKKKKEKQKDFQKTKLKVGKTKAKASNFTDTSFKSKAIVMGHQSLSTEAPDVVQQFKHNLSLASSSRSDKQRKDALAYLTSQLALEPPVNPVGTATVLTKLVPLISDSVTPVRQQLLKLLRVLPPDEVKSVMEHCIMFIRAGMTHLSSDISNDALAAMDWLLDVADDELVTCPGGWVRTLTTFCAMMGWAVASSTKGWTTAANARTTLKPKDAQNRAKQIATLAKFLQAGFKPELPAEPTSAQFWDNLYRIPRSGNAFEYLNLLTAQRDEDAEMYPNKEARQQIFHKRFLDAILKGIDQTKKEGGVTGRAAVGLEQALAAGMKDFEVSTALDTQDLLDLCFKSIPSFEMDPAYQPAPDAASGQEPPADTVESGIISSGTFDGSAPIYQWNDEYGDVGPKIDALELELFGDPATRHEHTGLDFRRIESIEVKQEGPVKITPVNSFKDAGLHPVMLENVRLAGYDHPTPIQKFTIPAIVQGRDVIGIAQTGSGKTGAYLIPILSRLMGKAKKLAAPRPNPATFCEGRDEVTAEPLVLIVAPTRELAVQIFNEARKFCYRTMLRPGVVYGGTPVAEQIHLLNRGCDVLIGTPGRLVSFINKPRVLTLRRLKYLIIDEADEMLDIGWQEDIQRIMLGGDQDEGNVKYGLFSATFPKAARDLAKEHLAAAHVRFRVGRAGSTTENIKQLVVKAEPHEKRNILLQLLNEMHGVRTIIFANSRQEVDCLDDFLFNMKLPVTSMHSDRTQLEREAAMRSFRAGTAPILIATGVTARGIDVRNVMHVINYDLPSMDHGGIEEYTHRIGRTGRIGHRGVATSLFTERDEPIASVLTRTLLETNQEIPEFLEIYKPQVAPGKAIQFETESDFDPNEAMGCGDDAGQDAWGGEAQAANPTDETPNGWGQEQQAPAASNGWGHEQQAPQAPQAAPADNGWGGPPPAAAPRQQVPTQSWGGPAPPATVPAPTGPAPQAWGATAPVASW